MNLNDKIKKIHKDADNTFIATLIPTILYYGDKMIEYSNHLKPIEEGMPNLIADHIGLTCAAINLGALVIGITTYNLMNSEN